MLTHLTLNTKLSPTTRCGWSPSGGEGGQKETCAPTLSPFLHPTQSWGLEGKSAASLHPSQHQAAIQMLEYNHLAEGLVEVRSFTHRSALLRSEGIGWGVGGSGTAERLWVLCRVPPLHSLMICQA